MRRFRAVRLAVGVWAGACVGASVFGAAADVRPVVGPGATRAEALAAYGWPAGQSQSGTREILTYPQGRIYLENGRVDRVDFSPTASWPAPRPRPAAAATTGGPGKKEAKEGEEHWTADFLTAANEARTRHARILAVFTGSDWSPGSRQFEEEVATDPDFINTFLADYVFLRVDFPSRKPLPDVQRVENASLRERYGVTTYPSMLVLSPAGTLLAKVDLENLPAGDSYKARLLAALRSVRDAIAARPPALEAVDTTTGGLAEKVAGAPSPSPKAAPTQLGASLSSASWLVSTSLAGGALFVISVLWWLWKRGPGATVEQTPAVRSLAGAAPIATPALDALPQWSKPQLCAVTARLLEAEGYKVALRPAGGDVDLAVARTGSVNVHALVVCVPAIAGKVSAKRVRELLGSVALEAAEEGWLVGTGGFAPEAQAVALEKGLTAIDAAALSERVAALPPLARGRLLGGMG